MSNKERPSALEEKKFRAEFDEQSNEESLRHRRECSDSSVYEGPEPRKKTRNTRKIQIAVAGCSHGEMDKIYAALSEIERQRSIKFDLLISCGDYQAVRNYGDLKHMHVKEKFRDLQTFYRYYSGDVVAPILTIFVGGNHEASGFLQELPFGGWVAPRIYYMGHASVIQFAGLRIAGLSGIYNKFHFDLGHFERPPFKNKESVISIYHVRSVDMFRLKQLKSMKKTAGNAIDIFVSHDWPSGITDFGNKDKLLKIKPYFAEDIAKNRLGNPHSMGLLYALRPRYWLAAHLHVAFAALVPHEDDCNDGDATGPAPTRFLSLDKPVPHRHFLQQLEFDVDENTDIGLSYDPAWLAILKSTDLLTSTSSSPVFMPSRHKTDERWDFRPTEKELEEIDEIFKGQYKIPNNFEMTAPPHKPGDNINMASELYYRNSQTTHFCRKLGISDLNELLCAQDLNGIGIPFALSVNSCESEQEKFRSENIVFGESDFIIDRGSSDRLKTSQPQN